MTELSTSAEYERQAQECLRLAKAAFHPRVRDRLVERAAHFKMLARKGVTVAKT
jgi:hypothetical protein